MVLENQRHCIIKLSQSSLSLSLSLSLAPSLPQMLTKNIIFSWQQNSCSEKIQRHLFADVYQKVFFFLIFENSYKNSCAGVTF